MGPTFHILHNLLLQSTQSRTAFNFLLGTSLETNIHLDLLSTIKDLPKLMEFQEILQRFELRLAREELHHNETLDDPYLKLHIANFVLQRVIETTCSWVRCIHVHVHVYMLYVNCTTCTSLELIKLPQGLSTIALVDNCKFTML